MLTNEELWRRGGISEDNIDKQYKYSESDDHPTSESEDSDNKPVCTRSPCKITPFEIQKTLDDKTAEIIINKRNVARKCKTRKAEEPRPTLAPQWNINIISD